MLDELFHYPWCPSGGGNIGDYEPWQELAGQIRQGQLAHAQPFVVSNVAEYMYKSVGEDGWELLTDFPRPMPPFKLTWMEWTLPRESRRERGGKLGSFWARELITDKAGCLIAYIDAPERLTLPGFAEIAGTLPTHLMRISVFIRPYGKKIMGVLPGIIIGLDDDYNPVPLGGKHVMVDFNTAPNSYSAEEWRNRCDEEAVTGAMLMVNVPLLAMSLLNCRNVSMRTVHTDPALVRANRRRGKHVSTAHHIIEIQPMVRRIQHVTRRDSYSRDAAPVVRGHFKDYRERGLFGKHKGIFWWDEIQEAGAKAEYRLKNAIGPLSPEWDTLTSAKGPHILR